MKKLPTKRNSSRRGHATRKLHLQNLEDRTLLTTFSVINLDDSGDGSLRQAILDANTAAGPDVISFAHDLEGTIGLTGGELVITDDLTIDGPGSETITVSGSGLTRVFDVSADVAINDLTVADGVAGATLGPIALGGGILNQGGTLTVTDVKFANNQAAGLLSGGGAVANVFGASTTLVDSSFHGNSISADILALGGAIANDVGSTLSVSGSTFGDNQATGDFVGCGGAISNLFGSQAEVSDSSFESNLGRGVSADGNEGNGGAICNVAVSLVEPGFERATLTVRHSTFIGNQAIAGNGANGGPDIDGGLGGFGGGGAIINLNATLNVEGSRFVDNQAIGGDGGTGGAGANGGDGGFGRGGAINNAGLLGAPTTVPSILNIVDSEFIRNAAIGGDGGTGGDGGSGGNGGDGWGGGLRTVDSTMNVTGSKLLFNQATGGNGGQPGSGGDAGNGGHALGGGIINGRFDDLVAPGVANVSNTLIVQNRATGGAGSTGGNGWGGGIYNNALSTITFSHSHIHANRAIGNGPGAEGVGGGVYNLGTFDIDNLSPIRGNKALTSHDDVFGDLTLLNDLLTPLARRHGELGLVQ